VTTSPGRARTFEVERTKVRALILVPDLARYTSTGEGAAQARNTPDHTTHSPADRLAEAVGLAHAIDLPVADSLIVPVARPRPATLLGSGKVEQLADVVRDLDVGLVVVDHALTPIQQRNLERAWDAKVLDRTGLILEIFGRRARTREGRLQVELAHLTFQRSRLVRSWTHLERQRGGFGFLGGPGETQIETDRRLLQERIEKIRGELDKVKRTRALHRAGRAKVPYPIVAIVGYTNAGKSTLFNYLTGADVLSEDQVFATLDPTMRERELPSGRRVILSDTVGFISDLPTMLVAAFRATLEEVIAADVILHVRDISHPETEAQRRDVEDVLESLFAETGSDQIAPIIEVWNKIDLVPDAERPDHEAAARRASNRDEEPVLTSALTGEGLDALLERIDRHLASHDVVMTIDLPPTAGRVRHWLHENTAVTNTEQRHEGTVRLTVRVPTEKHGRLLSLLDEAGLSAHH
jgi:GTP-binding protein HflX